MDSEFDNPALGVCRQCEEEAKAKYERYLERARAVIGRSIPFITPDFQAANMKLGNLYTALSVDKKDYKHVGSNISDPDEALQLRLLKIIKLDDPEYLARALDTSIK